MERVRDEGIDGAAARHKLAELVEVSRRAADPVLELVVESLEAAIVDRDSSTRNLTECQDALARARVNLAEREDRLSLLFDTAERLVAGCPSRDLRESDSPSEAPAFADLLVASPEAPSPRPKPSVVGPVAVAEPAGPQIEIGFFGGFSFAVDGVEVDTWRGARTAALAQFLVHRRERPVDAEVIIEALWPELHLRVGRQRVHQVVYQLRQALKSVGLAASTVTCHNGAYQFTPPVPPRVDTEQMLDLVADAKGAERRGERDAAIQAYAAAHDVYRGDFLSDGPATEWAGGPRDALRLCHIRSGIRLAELMLARLGADAPPSRGVVGSETSVALRRIIEVCADLASLEPWNEQVARLRMHTLALAGNRARAIVVYRDFVDKLESELGVGPSPETVELYHAMVD